MVYQTGGGNVDSPTGGVKINLVPKEGGNRFTGSLFEGYETKRFQASNGNDFLYSHGVTSLDQIGTYSDTDFTQGGPLKKDMLWFFGSGRLFTVNKPIASTIVGDGTSAGAIACYNGAISCAQGVDPQHQYSALARLTWQMSPRNKLSAYMDRIHKVREAAMAPGDDQATSSVRWNSPNYMTATVKYTSTVSSRLLIEGGYSTNIERYNNLYAEGVEKPYGSDAWLATARHYDSTFGRRWVASDGITGQYPDRYNAQGSATYVTGTHSFKFGFQDSWGTFNHVNRGNGAIYQNYVTTSGVLTPQTVTVYDTPVWSAEALNANLGFYAQDVWTLKRATFTIGGRYEHVSESVIGQPAQNGRFGNLQPFGDIQMPIWNNFSPRTAAVIDLFGTGKTAVRVGYNRFMSAATTTLASLYNPSTVVSQQLPWTDLNRDDVAQGSIGCVYLTPGCEINFASLPTNFGVVALASPDPNLKRPFVDQYNVGVTHEVMRGVSVSAEWFHNDSKNVMLRTNVLRPGTYNSDGTVTNPSYRPVTVFSPIDGTPIVVYDVTAASASQTRNVDTNDNGLTQGYNALEFNVNARLPHGARLFGGTATDRTVANTCTASATNPNFLITIGGVNYCDQNNSGIPWRTQWKVAATFPLPWYGLVLSGSYQGLPGYQIGTQALTAGGAGNPNFTSISGVGSNMTVTSATRYAVCPGNSASQGCVVGALIAPGALSTLTVPLAAPGVELMPRVNQVDFSIGKRFQIGGFRFDPKIDLFNALNSSDYFTVRTSSFTPTAAAGVSAGTYLYPGSIIQGRLLRIAAVVNW